MDFVAPGFYSAGVSLYTTPEQAAILEGAGGWEGLSNLTVCVPGELKQQLWACLSAESVAAGPAYCAPRSSDPWRHLLVHSTAACPAWAARPYQPSCSTQPLPAEGYYATKALQRQYGINVIETKLEEAVDAVKGEDFSCSALAYDSGAACLPLACCGLAAPRCQVRVRQSRAAWGTCNSPSRYATVRCCHAGPLAACSPRHRPAAFGQARPARGI